MSVYFLARKVTAAQSNPHTVGSQVVKPPGPQNANLPPPQQTFELTVTGIGNVDATAALVGSNDVENYEAGAPMQWSSIGANPLVATGVDTATASVTSDVSFQFYSAYITSINGTSASAVVRMAA